MQYRSNASGFAIASLFLTFALFALGKILATTLFNVSTTDPLTFGGVSLVLAVVAFVASYLPALRATRSDPIRELRLE